MIITIVNIFIYDFMFCLEIGATYLLTFTEFSVTISRNRTKRRKGSMSNHTDNTAITIIKQGIDSFWTDCKDEDKYYCPVGWKNKESILRSSLHSRFICLFIPLSSDYSRPENEVIIYLSKLSSLI